MGHGGRSTNDVNTVFEVRRRRGESQGSFGEDRVW